MSKIQKMDFNRINYQFPSINLYVLSRANTFGKKIYLMTKLNISPLKSDKKFKVNINKINFQTSSTYLFDES